jgi:hypothetical protein
MERYSSGLKNQMSDTDGQPWPEPWNKEQEMRKRGRKEESLVPQFSSFV